MRVTPITRAVAGLLAICAVWAQNLVAPQDQPRPSDEDVIHINVNLVQVDAVVTDSKHHLVTDLRASDFQVLQDGKPQKITNFSYVSLRPAPAIAAAAPPAKVKGIPPPPPVPLRPEQARRLIALVVDDLGLAFDSVARVRGALKKFVDEQMQPGDLVAIVRTGAGMGALQQFTADKRVLYAAIDRVRFNSMGRVGVSSFDPLGSGERTTLDAEREGVVAAGSLGAIRYVVNGLRELPGRKAVVLFSENLKLFSRDGENVRVMQGVRELEDAANRASVVIYSIDPRGLETLQLTAADNTGRMSAKQISRVPMIRSAQQFRSQEGMVMLANDTGGRFFSNSNDIAGALRDAVTDTEGYYLLGYHPDASTFDVNGRPKFHSVKVKLLRAGLEVRSRSGFFGRSDLLHEPKPQGRQAEMAAALSSPFGANGIHVRLTTVYAQSPSAGPFVTAMLYIDPKDLRFTDQPDGWHKALFDVAAVTFDANGQPVDSSGKTYTMQLKDAAYENALKTGLVYTMQHPVKKPGAYQMRVALRDADSGQVGSASEFIEVPDVSKGKLTLSSLVLRKYVPDAAIDTAKPNSKSGSETSSLGNPATRMFEPGDDILYGYQILNAHGEANQKPEIESFARVFRDGQEIFTGKPQPLDMSGEPDPSHLVGGGVLRLGTKMAPGDYVVQIVVTDQTAKSTAAQWTDFQVTEPTAPAQQ
jgi:VWFA-related protein